MVTKVRERGEFYKELINIYMIVYMFIWVIMLVFMMWKARFGAASYDESLYLSIPGRLSQGDAMIWDEWNMSQQSFLATVPFVYLYSHLSGGMEGITLAYRYYSVIVWSLVSFAIYLRLRRCLKAGGYSEAGAMTASLAFMVYAPFGLMVLSYNTYAILALVISGLILFPDADAPGPSRIRWILAGFFYAYSVLCCPHILLIWGLGFIYSIVKKRVRSFIDFTLGAAGLALVLMICILSRTTVGRILEAVPVMLSDPYHQQVSLWGYMKDYVLQVLFGIPNAVWIYICFGVLILLALTDRKRREHKSFYFVAGCILTLALFAAAWLFRRYINCFVYPVNILALLCLILDRDRRMTPMYLCFWLPGMLYSFCIDMASNQYWLAISSASLVALVGSITIVSMSAGDIIKDKALAKGPVIMFSLVMFILFVFVLSLRYSFVFMDSNISEQTELIDEGPQKGIMASIQDKEAYYGILADMEKINEMKPDRVLIFARDNWPYLTDSWRCGAYSPWLQNEIDDYAVETLMNYYEMDPSRKPDVIYIDPQYRESADKLLDLLNYAVCETRPSGHMIAVPR